MTRSDYVRKFWPLAVSVGTRWGIDPVAMIAHALKESGAGNTRAEARHNYFGFLKAGKHLVYPTAEAGYTAYARRLATAFEAAALASGSAEGFARAVAYSSKPTYVNEPAAKKAVYARTLAAIYKSVAADVARLRLNAEPVVKLSPRPVTSV